jgi:hypothetical protein
MPAATFEQLIETLKLTVATLREADIPFMLGGSLAAWARGGPEPKKDLDMMLRPQDADAALEALAGTGMRTERPPEEWLVKAFNDDVLVDLIFRPSGLEINDETLARADLLSVMAVATPVMRLEDMLLTMLFALDEHSLNYGPILGIARALREQIDWPELRARTSESPFAKAFFTLVQELGIAPAPDHKLPAPRRVRVLSGGAST